MKKTYIAPTFVAVELRSKSQILSGSLIIDGTKTVSGTSGGWVKEDYNSNTVNDVNVWDNEW